MDPVRHRRECARQQAVLLADGAGAVYVHRRARCIGDALERNILTGQGAVLYHEPRGQYAFAHTASVVAARPHLRQCSGAVAERNSGSGNTRMVALVSSLTAASHAASPHQPAYTNAPSPSMISLNRS